MVTRGSRALLRPAEEPTLLCAFPLRHQRSMRALAIPLEICIGFKLLKKSDIFIVRGWDSGQPLTIIRGIFLRDVSAQMLNLNSTIVSFCFSGALKLKLDTCMTCANSEKCWRPLIVIPCASAKKLRYPRQRNALIHCGV